MVSEHRSHRLRCPCCKRKTAAGFPVAVAGSSFGPRLQAAVLTLTARNRSRAATCLSSPVTCSGSGLSVGAVEAICQRGSTRPCRAARSAGRVGSRLAGGQRRRDRLDDGREDRTLWTATTPEAAIFRIAADRHRDRLHELLGQRFAGICCSDRWWAYNQIDPESRQACWSHLQRDFRFHCEGLPAQKLFGEQASSSPAASSKPGTATNDTKTAPGSNARSPRSKPSSANYSKSRRKTPRNKYHRGFANNLLKIWPALWTFVTNDGVEPTNNAAERSLRGPVIHRKLSHGTRSHDGERFVERALSASVTCRLQKRPLFAYLTNLLTADARGARSPPSSKPGD